MFKFESAAPRIPARVCIVLCRNSATNPKTEIVPIAVDGSITKRPMLITVNREISDAKTEDAANTCNTTI